MGATERERRRLALQGSILNSSTARFLEQSRLSPGMDVLDLGCGIGDVSLIAARIVGPHGSVTGLDLDKTALEVAQDRAREEHLVQLTFEQADFMNYNPNRLFDAVVGRHVLIHSRDPLGWIGKIHSLLRTSGIAAFQEYDLSYFPRIEPDLPLFCKMSQCLVQFFSRVAAYADTGARLYHWMELAGFSNTQSSAECFMGGGAESLYYEWFAETLGSVAPHLESFGIVSTTELDLRTLAIRLRDEAVSHAGCLTTPLIVSCAGERL